MICLHVPVLHQPSTKAASSHPDHIRLSNRPACHLAHTTLQCLPRPSGPRALAPVIAELAAAFLRHALQRGLDPTTATILAALCFPGLSKCLSHGPLCGTQSFSLQSLCALQRRLRPSTAYMEAVQQDINPVMRSILVDWLVEVAQEYKLVSDTLFLAVSFLDRFLSVVPTKRNRLQLVSLQFLCCLITQAGAQLSDHPLAQLLANSDHAEAPSHPQPGIRRGLRPKP